MSRLNPRALMGLQRTLEAASPGATSAYRLGLACPVAWEEMTPVEGEPGVRHCGECQQRVFDLVGKSEAQIAATMEAGGGELCGQVMIRGDGLAVLGPCGRSRGRIMRGRIVRSR